MMKRHKMVQLLISLVIVILLASGVFLWHSRPVEGQSSAEDSFSPASLIQLSIVPTVAFASSTSQFTFTYAIESSPQSRQKLDEFDLTIGPRDGIGTVQQAQGMTSWKGVLTNYPHLGTDVVTWGASSVMSNNTETLFTPDPEAIPPGKSLSGLGIQCVNLPGIRLEWAKGWVKPLRLQEIIDYVNAKKGTHFQTYDEIPSSYLSELVPQTRPDHEDALQGKTVGPDILPANVTTDQLLDRLIGLKEQAFQLGWIDNQGVANSLDAKLKEAKLKLQAGQTKVAGNILKSFVLDLIAQHVGQTGQGQGQGNPQGKHVNDNAFYLLKPNAEFILYKLGQL